MVEFTDILIDICEVPLKPVIPIAVDGDAGLADAQVDRFLVIGIVGVDDEFAVLDFDPDLTLGAVGAYRRCRS